MSEEKKKKRWKSNFFSCRGQFELIGGLVDHRIYWAWPNAAYWCGWLCTICPTSLYFSFFFWNLAKKISFLSLVWKSVLISQEILTILTRFFLFLIIQEFLSMWDVLHVFSTLNSRVIEPDIPIIVYHTQSTNGMICRCMYSTLSALFSHKRATQ